MFTNTTIIDKKPSCR